ncbi:MAG TPA: ABC transporter ATP-binding protein [Stellaceae bacterium]|nr:ABC transporter ATP-binding protein [Stellaceae bacterium]
MTTSPLLQVQHLRKYFYITKGLFSRVAGQVHAIEDVSFDIAPREVLGLAGESGSGKTTIGRAVLRLVEATSGQVLFDGKNVLDFDARTLRDFRRSAQIIFQDPYASIDPTMTVADVVAEPLRVQSLARGSELVDRVEKLLADVSLSADFMRRRPAELSGGQRQRVVIARALAVEPRFIVADEPVSALDVSIQAQIIRLLEDLEEQRGFSMLFISHDLAIMEYLSDRIAVVYLGRLMEIGPSTQVVSRPRHPYTEALISAVPDTTNERKRIILKGEVPSPVAPPSGCVFRTRCPYALPACSQEVPAMREVLPGHWKACLRDDVP